jgi:hypothetical protein
MPSLIPAFLKNGVFVAIIAQGLIGISLIWDKILFKHPKPKTWPPMSCGWVLSASSGSS